MDHRLKSGAGGGLGIKPSEASECSLMKNKKGILVMSLCIFLKWWRKIGIKSNRALSGPRQLPKMRSTAVRAHKPKGHRHHACLYVGMLLKHGLCARRRCERINQRATGTPVANAFRKGFHSYERSGARPGTGTGACTGERLQLLHERHMICGTYDSLPNVKCIGESGGLWWALPPRIFLIGTDSRALRTTRVHYFFIIPLFLLM